MKDRKNKSKRSDLEDKILRLERDVRLKQKEIEVLRSVFLKHIPHEIRTPMNSIVGFSTLLAKSRLSGDEKMEYLHHINASSEELLMVLDNLVDMALLHSGQIDLDLREFSLEKLIMELHLKYEERCRNLKWNKIQITHKLGGSLRDSFIKTDRFRLKQVLEHLIQNAIKFTSEGMIELRCRQLQQNSVEFTVSDTGKGISPNDTPHIFDSFRKQAGPPSEHNRGLGLGLSISREMVELLGGRLEHEQNQPHGSVFRFHLEMPVIKGKEFIQVDRSQDKVIRKITNPDNGLAI